MALQKLDWDVLRKILPKRKPDANKADFGHVLVIGGAPGFNGAARLAAESALRVGAGLVSVATHPQHAATLNCDCPELMVHGVKTKKDLAPLLERATVILLGSGLGQSTWGKLLWNAAIKTAKPLVLDADGLNILASTRNTKRTDWILTPHPGEASRLLQTSTQEIQSNRVLAVQMLVEKYNAISVLKGADTLVADHSKVFLNDLSDPGMATAGTGDVLAGITVGLLAQGLSLIDTAKLAVMIHSKSAEADTKTHGQRGMIASDIWKHMRHYLN